jgi:hypothetical protein
MGIDSDAESISGTRPHPNPSYNTRHRRLHLGHRIQSRQTTEARGCFRVPDLGSCSLAPATRAAFTEAKILAMPLHPPEFTTMALAAYGP